MRMPEVQCTDSPRLEQILEIFADMEVKESEARRNTAQRSVSFNRDVYVKRIGRESPYITAFAEDGEGRLLTNTVKKESIKLLNKEDLVQEVALILQQAESVDSFAHGCNRKCSSLPNCRCKSKQRFEIKADVRRQYSKEINNTFAEKVVDIPKVKKKVLQRSFSDAESCKIKQTNTKLFSPQLERKKRLYISAKLLKRSKSDVGSYINSVIRLYRKRSGSESEGSLRSAVRDKKLLSPINELSAQVLDQKYHFGGIYEDKQSKQAEKEKKLEQQVKHLIEDNVFSTRVRNIQIKIDELRSPIEANNWNLLKKEKIVNVDEVDRIDKTMLHSSRYDQYGNESTIHKMINRLTNDRSPPPQLTRIMMTPGLEFGHNNNRPFSYTRQNESNLPTPQTDIIYTQVQLDKNKAQRSHSDSDEGLGLERKDSSRENSPPEKEYHCTDYYKQNLQRNNEINKFKSLYDNKNIRTNNFVNFGISMKKFTTRNTEPKRSHDFNDIKQSFINQPEKYTSTIFVDTLNHSGADGMDAKRKEKDELGIKLINNQVELSKTSELSARRDLLESRIRSRLLADEIFAAKSNLNLPKNTEHEIIDKPIVPSPVIPNHVTSPKRYMDTYISETRTNSNGEKYIFKKEIHENNGNVYGYEKKITNKIPTDTYMDPELREGYTVETHTDKYGDKYIVETRTHGSCIDNFIHIINNQNEINSKIMPTTRLLNGKTFNCVKDEQLKRETWKNRIHLPHKMTKKFGDCSFSKAEVFLDTECPKRNEEFYETKVLNNFKTIREKSKSTQRLDELTDNTSLMSLKKEYITRSHENLTSTDYVNTSDFQRLLDNPASNDYKERSSFEKCQLDSLKENPNDEYNTDIFQAINNQQELSKYYKKTKMTQKYVSSKHGLQDDYNNSSPHIRVDRNEYNSSRYDSDTTTRDSILCETSRCINESCKNKKDYEPVKEDLKKLIKRSKNRLDYLDDSDTRESTISKSTKGRLETFDEVPQRPSHVHHESKIRHTQYERGYSERCNRETRLNDFDRKDRLTDSGIENDYRRDSQEVDSRREHLESEDEGFVTMQLIKQERRHTDCNMNLSIAEKRCSDKYIMYYETKNEQPVTSKPPSGADVKKYEKKVVKKSGTLSKVKELFRKKEKKAKEEKNKLNVRASNTRALTDDEVTMRYWVYRGDHLTNARSIRDLESEVNEDECRQRRRLSTPSGSPSPSRPSRLSRSTGTLSRPEQQFRHFKSTHTQEIESQEVKQKGWFKSLSGKNKSSAKPVNKKPQIPESEILTTGTEDEEAFSAPERNSVQKNLRFFGDTDQESIASNRDRRIKQDDNHAKLRREYTNISRYPLGIVLSPRKTSRLAESALSSGESTTGDSSQQSQNSQRSQRSVVYLHAATVGEIPSPNERRRAVSREELSRPLTAHTRTISRSVSVLAPWRPRHYHESYEINYDQHQLAKPVTMRRKQQGRETLSRHGKEPNRVNDTTSKTGTINRHTLKSKDKQKVDRTVSTESLASKSRNISSRQELNRSASVPRDPNKSAGWFKLKSKKSRV